MRNILKIAAGTAIAMSGAAIAQDRTSGQDTREQARQNSQGPANANERGIKRSNKNSVLKGQQQTGHKQSGQDRTGSMQNSQDHTGHDMQNKEMQRGNSQGSQNASPRAQERASENSAVRQGMEAHDRSGKRVGEVREVRRSSNGTVIAIVVVLVTQVNNTNVVTLPASSFTIVNNVVVINDINVNIGS